MCIMVQTGADRHIGNIVLVVIKIYVGAKAIEGFLCNEESIKICSTFYREPGSEDRRNMFIFSSECVIMMSYTNKGTCILKKSDNLRNKLQ